MRWGIRFAMLALCALPVAAALAQSEAVLGLDAGEHSCCKRRIRRAR